jgi:probable rRNA maturation factor
MPVSLQVRVRSVRFGRQRVLRLAQTILDLIGESSADLGLSFVGDRRMRGLNHRFRGKDRSTDVLAFASREARTPASPVSTQLLGDIVISVPTALRQAKEGHRSLEEEIVALLIHGALHLCGYDHERGHAESRRMRREERTVRLALGRIASFAGRRHQVRASS